AIELLETVAADTERLLGAEHPNTLTARGNLAAASDVAAAAQQSHKAAPETVSDPELCSGTSEQLAQPRRPTST
ncbi:hypothetical protein AB0C71_28180, partial [Streptomyces anulatus]|uniref:hypothetical protein n=2 Tax=Streptomyces TaxID=1883 RepID=UPI0033F4FF66